MSKFKRKIEIMQQTPLLHFQTQSIQVGFKKFEEHEQKGDAALRASELKPKIDKFICYDLQSVDNELFNQYEDIILKYFTKKILDKKNNSPYKVNIISSLNRVVKKQPISPYFGKYNAIITDNPIVVEFFSFNNKLLDLLEEVIPYVFVLNNFGTRQSKGYGGYYPSGISKERYEEILKKKFQYVFEKDISNLGKSFEQVIQEDYQLLKSGINNPYKKSLLWRYFNNKNIKWEKRVIKERIKDKDTKIFNGIKGTHECCINEEKVYKDELFVRAVLGLAPTNTFKEIEVKTNKKNGKEKKIGKIKRGGYQVQARISHDESKEDKIDRFKSPILMKVFNNKIYIVADKKNADKILGKVFKFQLEKIADGDRRGVKIGKPIYLKTPTREQFDMDEFLKWALQSKEMGYKLLE